MLQFVLYDNKQSLFYQPLETLTSRLKNVTLIDHLKN